LEVSRNRLRVFASPAAGLLLSRLLAGPLEMSLARGDSFSTMARFFPLPPRSSVGRWAARVVPRLLLVLDVVAIGIKRPTP
jgi:hypothetical protein